MRQALKGDRNVMKSIVSASYGLSGPLASELTKLQIRVCWRPRNVGASLLSHFHPTIRAAILARANTDHERRYQFEVRSRIQRVPERHRRIYYALFKDILGPTLPLISVPRHNECLKPLVRVGETTEGAASSGTAHRKAASSKETRDKVARAIRFLEHYSPFCTETSMLSSSSDTPKATVLPDGVGLTGAVTPGEFAQHATGDAYDTDIKSHKRGKLIWVPKNELIAALQKRYNVEEHIKLGRTFPAPPVMHP